MGSRTFEVSLRNGDLDRGYSERSYTVVGVQAARAKALELLETVEDEISPEEYRAAAVMVAEYTNAGIAYFAYKLDPSLFFSLEIKETGQQRSPCLVTHLPDEDLYVRY